jgi:ABC-type multidrug transport system ATPase subunit
MSLNIRHVYKQYRGNNTPALTDFSLNLEPGILGLLGPNGAGKSTLMRIIATITKPSQGTILWNGDDICKNPDIIRKELGYLPQDFGVYPNLDADEFLLYMAALKGVKRKAAEERIDDLLAFVNLLEARRRPLGEYSGGMKQRIGVAQALLNDPRILIVDEPTVGLDPEGRVRFRHLLAELARDRVVILSTHIVSDVEATANEIAIINRGQLVTLSPSEELLRVVEGKVWDWVISSFDLPIVRQRYLLSSVIHRDDGLHVRVVTDEKPDQGAQQALTPTLEEAYLYCIATNRGVGPL